MHTKNIHRNGYELTKLTLQVPELKKYLISTPANTLSIDFSNPTAVYLLNKALLMSNYALNDWNLPGGYLCPAVPSRADYIHHLADLISIRQKSNITGLDIGTGANAIYALLGVAIYDWNMIGVDIQRDALAYAEGNVQLNPALSKHIELRLQSNPGNILCGILSAEEYVDFTLCNPPFYSSQKEADAATRLKNENLSIAISDSRNFSGQTKELYCNGGEALFVKRMIKESVLMKDQVGVFSSLISKARHLPKLEKQLKKLPVSYRIIPMSQGNKKSRILAWTFKTGLL
ncbi:23S rRNA (adenine(1618)-N(6))-methyltransferase RlmF [Gangjinia marincola]|uniref:23S rRNA (Adenine(1618)-N(6))-methyltransferase RlmF n=1 Tax=Gangjinia marincola TaxID=578463 RepID=A0ABP3XR13_9FLAO